MTVKTQRTALVTGANRGIGYEVAKELARKGLRVLLTGRDRAAVAAAAGLRRDRPHPALPRDGRCAPRAGTRFLSGGPPCPRCAISSSEEE